MEETIELYEIDQKEIDRLLAARDLIMKHQARDISKETDEDQKEKVDELMKGLADLGFYSLDDFDKFNEEMRYKGFKYSANIQGYCDKCEGVESGPWCVLRLGAESCIEHKIEITLEVANQSSFRNYYMQKTQKWDIKGKNWTVGEGCPPGHGFHTKEARRPPFDVKWQLRNYISNTIGLEQYK